MRENQARTSVPRSLEPLDELLVLTGHTDKEAFARLYDEMSPRAYGLALRVIVDPDLAQEVVQEVFVEVWRKAARFDPARGTAAGWVLTIAHRRAVDRVRSTGAERRRDTAWHDATPETTGRDATFDAVHADIDAKSVVAALATLTPTHRLAIELAYFGGYTYTDVARLMKTPLGTTKTRIRTALRLLRDQMDIPAVAT